MNDQVNPELGVAPPSSRRVLLVASCDLQAATDTLPDFDVFSLESAPDAEKLPSREVYLWGAKDFKLAATYLQVGARCLIVRPAQSFATVLAEHPSQEAFVDYLLARAQNVRMVLPRQPAAAARREASAAAARERQPKPRVQAMISARRKAEQWLRSKLTGKPMLAAELYELQKIDGISVRDFRRATQALQCEARPTGYGGNWVWSLPEGTALASTNGPEA